MNVKTTPKVIGKKQSKVLPVRDSKTNPKIGRNDPCICGAKKKYKNCCGFNNLT